MQIVDNAPELDLSKPEDLAVFESALSGKQPNTDTSKKDVVDKDSKKEVVSSTKDESESDSDGETEPATVEEAQAKIKALQKELARRKGNAEKVGQLEQELSSMKSQLESLTKASKRTERENELSEAVKQLSDKELVEKRIDWDEKLASLRSRYDRAEEYGDRDKLSTLEQQIAAAKSVLAALHLEERSRYDRQRTEKDKQAKAEEGIRGELSSMYETLIELHPSFKEKDSPLWEAGNAEFQAYPVLMEQLGPVAQLVASAMAIVKHPELVGGKKESEIRKRTIETIGNGLRKAVNKGTGSAPSNNAPLEFNVESGDGLAAFNRLVDRVKGG